MALITCQECGKEISDKASACPHCGYPINTASNPTNLTYQTNQTIATAPKPKRKGGCLVSLLVFIAIFVLMIFLIIYGANSFSSNIQQQVSGVSSDEEYITLDEYNQIETGMSYDEVIEIVGSEGTISSKAETAGYKIVIVTWYGNGIAGSNANVTFTNDSVTAKAQVGLIEDTSSNEPDNTPAATPVPTVSPENIATESSPSPSPTPTKESVQITIPAYFLDTLELDVPAGDFVLDSYTNEDNSMTLVCESEEYYAFLSGFRQSITSNIEDMRTRDNSPYTAITYDDTLSSFEFFTTSQPPSEDINPLLTAIVCSAYYQALNGISEENINVSIVVTNSTSGTSTEFSSWKTVKDALDAQNEN